ncbi:MAG: hypothetical protein K2Y39_26770 [Candidatus Obscuribacterales bacterium]|nr:hypothetical protein [Candidatus Obscuribacterales bacterium]
MATLIVLLLVLPGLWATRQWLAARLVSVPFAPVAQNAAKAANLTVLFVFVLIFGYAGNVAPDAWDLVLGILSLFFVFVGVLWAYRKVDEWRTKKNLRS